MRKAILALAAVALLAVVVVVNAGSTPVNWKVEVKSECSKLVTSAKRTASAVLAGETSAAHNRAQRLRVRARHCNAALSEMP